MRSPSDNERQGTLGVPDRLAADRSPRRSAASGEAVVAVIVTHQVNPAQLESLLADLRGQVAAAVIVDNASADWCEPCASVPLIVQRLAVNEGLAAAQNRGLVLARAAGAAHALLLDQDSRPAVDMVAALLTVLQIARSDGRRVAAVGPQVLDGRGRCEGFVRFRTGRYEAIRPDQQQLWVDCDMLIASGSLIPLEVLDRVGPMAPELFIDKVDTEWSLRAAAEGYCLLGSARAVLHHRLGDRQVRLWFGRWRELPQHQPFRYYFMVRNSLLLQRRSFAHARWRRADRRQLLSLLIYFGVIAPGRGRALAMMLRGLVDGLRCKTGPLA